MTLGLPRPDPRPELDPPSYQVPENATAVSFRIEIWTLGYYASAEIECDAF